MKIYTIGHSTLTKDEFIGLLNQNGIKTLVDIRSYPGSRHCPHFSQESMAGWLLRAGIEYKHLVGLGGRKHTCADHSVNRWWTHSAFRSYADYALTDPFHRSFKELQKIAAKKPTAIMCAEIQWWRCHRRIVTDYLIAADWDVRHIMGERVTSAELSQGARPQEGHIVYPVDSPQLQLSI
jgi:uncharacterized protein (DUF488 family)